MRDRNTRKWSHTLTRGVHLLFIAALVMGLALLAGPARVAQADPGTIEVSQPVQVTSNSYYERGQSICHDGSDYWLFYGKSTEDDQPYDGGTPDDSNYELYYKKASSISGLTSATVQRVGSVKDVYQGQTSCAYYNSKVWVFYADASSNIEYFTYDGSWSGPTDIGFDGGGAPHLWVAEYDGDLHIVYNAPGGKIEGRYYNNGSWSSADDASTNEGMPRLYEDSNGDLLLTWVSWGTPAYYIHEYDSGWDTTADYSITGTANDDCDPWLFENSDGDYTLMFAPWDGTQQYISQWTASTLSGLETATDYMVTQGSYTTSNPWVDMWPTVIDNGADQYLFFTSERNPVDVSSEIAGNIWYMKIDWDMGRDHYTYIQNAIDAASAGDTINVADGTYTEQLSITSKGLTVHGDSESGVIVQANAGGPVDGENTFTIDADGKDVTIEYMTIRHGDYGIRSSAGNVKVLHCTVYHNGWDGTGVDSDPTQTEMAALWASSSTTNGGAIRIEGSTGGEVAYCTVYENLRGIRFSDSTSPHIHDCISHDNIDPGIYLSSVHSTNPGVDGAIVEDNEVYGNMNVGLQNIGGSGNIWRDNNVHDNWNAGVYVYYADEITFQGNTINHNNLYAFNGTGNDGDAYGGVGATGGNGGGTVSFALKLLNNTISNNEKGRQTQKIGVYLDGSVPDDGIEIKGNTFTDHDTDVWVESQAATTVVNDNNFDGTSTGVQNDDASATLHAINNWWGDASGPSGEGPGTGDAVSTNVDYDPWRTGVAPGTLQAVIDTASPGDVIQLGPYTYEGGITIDTPGITIILSDGTVIQASSPCFTVNADDTTITSADFPGGVCEPSNSSHGIQTGQAVNNLVIRNLEIRKGSTATGDGIHIGHDVNNLQIFDNYIHDMGEDGIEYATGVTVGGTVHEVQGNLFQDNDGYGANNVDGAEYNVEYNSWDHYDGPGSGDGANGNLDYTPWTHVALSMTSSDSPNTDEVGEGYEITYTIQMDAKKIWGADFDLLFDPTDLQVVSVSNSGAFDQQDDCDLTTGADFVSFCGQSNSAVTGTEIPVFEVVFEGLAADTVYLVLDETDDAFAMSPPSGGSNNIYASLLDDGSVTVYDATTVSGRVDLQGRADDTGAVMEFSLVGTTRGYGPFTFSTSDYWGDISASDVVHDTYAEITVSMDRYLDVTSASVKTVAIASDNKVLSTLVLLGGDANDSGVIDMSDASIIGSQFGNGDGGPPITDSHADINADGVVNILDLVLMGGNYSKTSDTYSSSWTP